MSADYFIGTRGSLLATTQSTLTKEQLEAFSHKKFELKLITTEGDQLTQKPLWQLDGKDFFTKELDHQLLAGTIDAVVHSYKDLGTVRPEGIKLAAVTQRSFASDVLLIKQETVGKLHNLDSFVVGTSSPRRIVNIEASLNDFIPHLKATVKTKVLRGNVNSRIEKLKNGDYDAIVLALAGVERLAHKENSLRELKHLLEGLNFLVLPQKFFPSCASQGSLGIEVNEQQCSQELLNIIKSVHCEKSFQEIKLERESFHSYGGGCHLAVGIHTKRVGDELVRFERGIHEDRPINKAEIIGRDYSRFQGLKAFIPMGTSDPIVQKRKIDHQHSEQVLFVTSSHCFHNISSSKELCLFTAGTRSWRQLAKLGYWVNASSEGFGHEEIQKLLSSKALQLMMPNSKLKVLTHDKGESELGEIIPCYSREVRKEALDLSVYDVFFWSSAFQYETYVKLFPEIRSKVHACGLGKTYSQLKEKIQVTPFIDIMHFKNSLEAQ